MRDLLARMSIPQLVEFACLVAEALIRAGLWSPFEQSRLVAHLRRLGAVRDKAA